jgi:3'(2'), 5'-bisphosphate nucleotidase
LTDPLDVTALLETARRAADAGARAIRPFLGAPGAVQTKADDSPVTQADLAAHVAIGDVLRAETPDLPVVSEEAPDAERASAARADAYWCVDPLDGTHEFIAGRPTFTVNVALIAHGHPLLGVILAPALDEAFWGGGGQAFARRGCSVPAPIRVRPSSPDALTVLISRTTGHLAQQVLREAEAAGYRVQTQTYGSSLKPCRIAQGAADFYPRFGPTSEWDTAAAQAILEAAGGALVTADGVRLAYGKPGLLNPNVFAVGDPALPWQAWLDGPA